MEMTSLDVLLCVKAAPEYGRGSCGACLCITCYITGPKGLCWHCKKREPMRECPTDGCVVECNMYRDRR